MLYPAGIAILCQGEKRGIFGDRTFTYNHDNFLIVSVSTPINCQTIAEANKPVFGLFIDAEISSIQSIAREMESSFLNRDAHSLGVEPVKMKAEMKEVVTRLVKIMPNQLESRILGEGIKKEILFRALESEHGHALYSLIQENSSQSRISKVIDYIKRNYREKMTVESLASLASMSSTSFHREFKLLTGESPLQYVKKTRLSRARSLIVHNGVKANVAAFEVGYESASHFTREFKRYYKVTPTKAKDSAYAEIDIW